MLIGYPSRTNKSKKTLPSDFQSSAVSRLLSAAVINKGFRDLLLSDPTRALAQGFCGEKFPLDPEQKAHLLSIRAESMSDFALQITSTREKEYAVGSGEWIPVNQPAFVLHAK